MQSRHRLYTSCKVVLKRQKIFDTCLEISYENKNLIVHMIDLNGFTNLKLQNRKNSDTSFNHHVFPDLFPSINFIVNLHSLMGI